VIGKHCCFAEEHIMEKEVVLYIRTSTADQHTDTQLIALQDYCKRMNYKIADTYVDSGYTGKNEQRPEFERLLSDIRLGKVRCLCVWKIDRIGRSLRHLLNLLEEFQNLGVEFISSTQSINSNSPEGRMFWQLLCVFADYERSLIVSRVKAGLVRAKREGKTLGRKLGSKDKGRRKKSGYLNRWLKARKGVNK
jgi:DNA invertase Pin-like site-specific DNA recombinase